MRIIRIAAVMILFAGVCSAQEDPEYRLMESVLTGDAAGVRAALAEGADPNAVFLVYVGYDSYDPADKPLSELEFEVIDPERFVMAGNCPGEVWPSLQGACEGGGNAEIARLLVRAGVDATYNRGGVLSMAVTEGNTDLLAELLSAPLDDRSRASAWLAAFKVHGERDILPVVEMFLDAGFDPDETLPGNKSVLQKAGESGCRDAVLSAFRSRGISLPYRSPLLGEWLSPDMDGRPGAAGKAVYRDDGTGQIYDRSGDTAPMDDFTYEFVSKDAGSSLYEIIQTYAPDNVWYALVHIEEIEGFGTTMTWAAWGPNVDVFPKWGDRVPFFWNGIRTSE